MNLYYLISYNYFYFIVSFKVKLFIHIQVLRGWTNRDIAQRFQHSGQTISKIVGEVVAVMRSVNHLFMFAPNADTPLDPRIADDPKIFPFFEDI